MCGCAGEGISNARCCVPYPGPSNFSDPALGLASVDDALIVKINAVNMCGSALAAKYAIAQMLKNADGSGVVVGNSSVSSALAVVFAAGLPLYHPTKAYMDGFTRMLAAAHPTIKAFNINCVYVDTPMIQNIFDGSPQYALDVVASMGVPISDCKSMCSAFNALARSNPQLDGPALITPAFVSDVVLALANGTTKYTSGQCVQVIPEATLDQHSQYDLMYLDPASFLGYDHAAKTHPCVAGTPLCIIVVRQGGASRTS